MEKRTGILFDLSDADPGKRYYSVNIFKHRFLDALEDSDFEDVTLLLGPQNESFYTGRFPGLKHETYIPYSGIFKKVPVLKSIMSRRHFRRFVNRLPYACFFSASNYDQKITARLKMRKVTLVHDIKGIDEAESPFGRYQIRRYYRRVVGNADAAIAISEYTRQSLISSVSGVNPERLTVIHNSVTVSESSVESVGVRPGKYVLFVNSMAPRKNFLTLLKAFSRITGGYDLDLVVVSGGGDYWNLEVVPVLRGLGTGDRVIVKKDVPDEELRYLYENATVFVSPSLDEGFGYTPVEAALCLCPVVCSRCGALPETTMGLADYYDDPLDDKMLADAIRMVLDRPKDLSSLRETASRYKDEYSPKLQKDRILSLCRVVSGNALGKL